MKLFFINQETRMSNVTLNNVSVLVGYSDNYFGNENIGGYDIKKYEQLFTIWKTKDISVCKTKWDDKWRLHISDTNKECAFERKSDALNYAKSIYV
jgi:hypothetical protein